MKKHRAYTPSRDGVERTTVTVRLRLTRDEVAALDAFARRGGRGRTPSTVDEVVWAEADLAVEGLIADVLTGRTR